MRFGDGHRGCVEEGPQERGVTQLAPLRFSRQLWQGGPRALERVIPTAQGTVRQGYEGQFPCLVWEGLSASSLWEGLASAGRFAST